MWHAAVVSVGYHHHVDALMDGRLGVTSCIALLSNSWFGASEYRPRRYWERNCFKCFAKIKSVDASMSVNTDVSLLLVLSSK